MEFQTFLKSKALNNIPEKKYNFIIHELDKMMTEEENSSKINSIIALKTSFIRYYESNIPIEYWRKSMHKDFVGNNKLKIQYDNYVKDIRKSFINGTSICFAGSHGIGKSLTACNILKRVVEKGYSGLYTTLSDVVHVLISAPKTELYVARKELLETDFLVLDEFDGRFMATESAADLFARSLESVFRTRAQNKMPTLMCTNSPNIIEAFQGPLKQSIDSLLSGYIEIVPILGQDYRKQKTNE